MVDHPFQNIPTQTKKPNIITSTDYDEPFDSKIIDNLIDASYLNPENSNNQPTKTSELLQDREDSNINCLRENFKKFKSCMFESV